MWMLLEGVLGTPWAWASRLRAAEAELVWWWLSVDALAGRRGLFVWEKTRVRGFRSKVGRGGG